MTVKYAAGGSSPIRLYPPRKRNDQKWALKFNQTAGAVRGHVIDVVIKPTWQDAVVGPTA
eukprot:1176966-Prorocentrum_minimum.AAC.1